MDCKEVQKLQGSFYRDKIDSEQAWEFIEHTLDCKECKEELAVYYMIEMSNSGKEPESYDIISLVEKHLNRKMDELHAERNHLLGKLFVWILANTVIFINILSMVMELIKK